ncbi:helix-hairpin-helix domain-containing protein [Pseudomonas sp. BW16M2]|uniref:ComEA family DNA-binding protein n=1 Tax=Pseudomonas sp. BW16M2 TaxID=2745489 RepID=UPI001645B456|nr:ComEA family DNA-binding protein [Pseudomonas sp. BW16M2]MBC3434990.1 helix-hairpin-helix domain-containing protein [Pseudomonas sp. BW16M2]
MRNNILPYVFLPLFAVVSSWAAAATPAVTDPSKAPSVAATIVAPVNVNHADASSLQQALSGIGQAKAQAIVDYRESHGPFTSVDELLEIKGIGKSLLERNRDKLVVE